MSDVDWARFFREYAAANRARDAAGVAAFYGDGFLVAGPTGASAFKNDDAFRAWLGALFEFNERAGMEGLEVAGVRESEIDARHVLVAVDWVGRFREAGAVPFRISYIVSLVGSGGPKVIGYISEEDQLEVMQRKGLIEQ